MEFDISKNLVLGYVMKFSKTLIFLGVATILSGCLSPTPRLVGDNRTGAATIATPSTFGVTTITTRSSQTACTEPRPNASVESALAANADLTAQQVDALVKAQVAAGSKVGASSEFESVEFLAHGLFGICQLASSGAISDGGADDLVKVVIEQAARISEPSTEGQN